MSKQMKLNCCMFSIDLNQFITAVVFLLILPISDLVGLMSLQVGLFAKFGL